MNLADLIKEYIAEAQEHFATAEDDILSLEQLDASHSKETINRLFRALHTIKGGAACVNFDSVKEFAHAMENIAGLLREGVLEANSEIAQTLLEGLDKLKGAVLSGKGDLEDSDSILERLRHIAQLPMNRNALNTESFVPISKCIFDLKHVNTADVKEQGLHIFEFTLDAVVECKRKTCTAAELLECFVSLGTLLASTPDQSLFLNGEPGFSKCSILLATMIDDHEVLFPGLQIEPISFIHYAPEDFPPFEGEVKKIVTEIPIAASIFPQLTQITEQKRFQQTPTLVAASPRAEQNMRIPVEIADKLMNLAGELVVVRNRNAQVIASGNSRDISAVNQRLDVVTSDIQRTIMRTRMQPIGNVFGRFSRVVRDLGRSLGKEVELEIRGADVELDKSIIDGIVEPLTHLVRNAVDHGIESPEERKQKIKPAVGHITLTAQHLAGLVNIEVTDDGKGINPQKLREVAVEKGLLTHNQVELLSDREALNLIFMAGFSTAKEITEVSGRGVGMDVVRASLQKLGGVVEIESIFGQGSTISIRLPLTLAIIPAIILAAEDQCFAVPQVSVVEVVWLHGDEIYQSIQKIDESEVYWLRGKMLPLIRLSTVLKIQSSFTDPQTGLKIRERRAEMPDRRQNSDFHDTNARSGIRERRTSVENSLYIIVLRVGSDSFGLCVERIVDTEEIVVKPLHERLKASKVYAGATVLGDGATALILDVSELARTGGIRCEKTENRSMQVRSSIDELQRMLVFTNGKERFAVPLCLLMRVDEISTQEVQVATGRELLSFRDSLIPLLRIEHAIPGIASAYDDDFIHAIIPRIGTPVGIAAAQIIDIVEIDNNTLIHSNNQSAIIGTQNINGHATTLLDLCVLINILEPSWMSSFDKPKENRRRVLLVEDSPLYCALASSYLRSLGLEIITAANGNEALDLIMLGGVDGIISDIEMPVMDGFDLARRLKADKSFQQIPLLGISSMDEKTVRPRALDAGFDEFRSKSNLPLLGETIESLLSLSERRV